jgi:branched-chain amino acid transport system ATP-binding protein
MEREQSTRAASTGPALLDVIGVRFGYGDLVAVWDVSLQARAGAVTAMVGSNGAGKTTLMFGLAGILPLVSGTVRIDGADIAGMSSWDRARAGLCLVPEGKRVFRDLAVEENIKVGLPRSVRGAERRERCEEVFERFPILGERRTQLAGALSGGQQQMLAIAAALAMRPRVLLVDEPSSGLAPLIVDQVMDSLDQLKHEGMAIVLVEQTVEDALAAIADEVIVIERGLVVERNVPADPSMNGTERRSLLR